MMPLGHIGIPLLIPIFGRDLDIDVRILILGAVIPDIIDKPLGHMILSIDNGRIIAHSLLFATTLLAFGMMFKRMLPLSIGVAVHQILDGMFLDPETALWPLLGPFGTYDFEVVEWFKAFGDPFVIGEELTGLALMIVFVLAFSLYRKEKLFRFIRDGRV